MVKARALYGKGRADLEVLLKKHDLSGGLLALVDLCLEIMMGQDKRFFTEFKLASF